jgi:hypothetical protein
LQAARHHRLDLRRDAGHELTHRLRRRRRGLPREHLVDHHPEGVEVRRGARGARIHLHLGRQGGAVTKPLYRHRVWRQGADQAEIGQLDPSGAVDQDRPERRQAVEHRLMRLFERVADVGHHIVGALERERLAGATLAFHQLAQALAIDELGGDVAVATLLAHAEHARGVLMSQARGQLHLLTELLRGGLAAGDLAGQDADRDRLAGLLVQGAVEFAESACSKAGLDLEASTDQRLWGDCLSSHRCRWCRRRAHRARQGGVGGM